MKRVSWLACGVLLLATSMLLTGCPGKPELATDATTYHFAAGITTWTFHVWNQGDSTTPLNFTIGADKPWITVTPIGRSANASDKFLVTVAIDSAAAAKCAPEFTKGTLTIESNGGDKEIEVTTAPDYFTEAYAAGVPLVERSLTFTPNGSPSFFGATNDPATVFPTDPTGGIDITSLFGLADPIEFTPWQNVSLYGVEYDRFFIGSSGNISFGSSNASDVTLADHFASPQITALSSIDATAGGMVVVKQTPTRIAVTYENVPTAAKAAGGNSVQVELFFDGTIRMTYTDVDAPNGIVGLSYGAQTLDPQGNPIPPADFVPSDFTNYNTSGGKTAP